MNYYIGIDLGGTFIKGGIADEQGKVIVKNSVPTEYEKGWEGVVNNMISLCKSLAKEGNIEFSQIRAIGAAIPGMIDDEHGHVIYSNNLRWKDVPIAKVISSALNLPVHISNDANVAALGEAEYGAAKGVKDSVTVTLGTGVGSGIIINGKIFGGAGAEIGHTVIHQGGEDCTCGRKGCFETYASATALLRFARRAMEQDKTSMLWQLAETVENVNGKHVFDAYFAGDAAATKVVETYFDDLATGLTNIANVFRPQVILLGGGVSAQKENLTKPVQERVNKLIYGGPLGPQVEIRTATLGNDAGFLGAVALAKQN